MPEILERLSGTRRIFHSEADFRNALAWEVKSIVPDASVRLEVAMFGTSRNRVDIVVRLAGGAIPIELKYWQARLHHVDPEGEAYSLTDQTAEDVGRAALAKDLSRIESLVGPGGMTTGWVVALTNNARYWREGRDGEFSSDAAFRISEGRVLAGSPRWRRGTAAGTMKGTEALELRGSYRCAWQDYSSLGTSRGELFRYLAFEVGPDAA